MQAGIGKTPPSLGIHIDPEGRNPAGVWIGDELTDAQTMQRIAAEVGYSETAFLAPSAGYARGHPLLQPGGRSLVLRACHDRDGGSARGRGWRWRLPPVDCYRRGTRRRSHSPRSARPSLTSVEPEHTTPSGDFITTALSALGWRRADLDASIPPAKAYAGAWHLVLAAARHERLAELDYDFDGLKAVMLREGVTTLQLIWRESEVVFHSRNPFPVGGVVGDPATGAAAAALGG